MRATRAVRRAVLTDVAYFPKQEIKISRRKKKKKRVLPSHASRWRFPGCVLVIHVFRRDALLLLLFQQQSLSQSSFLFFSSSSSSFFFYPASFPSPASAKLPLSRFRKARLLPASTQRLGWILHIAVSAVWISPPPHTPLNASLLLQHIIFADHKIHPQRFPGRTWH